MAIGGGGRAGGRSQRFSLPSACLNCHDETLEASHGLRTAKLVRASVDGLPTASWVAFYSRPCSPNLMIVVAGVNRVESIGHEVDRSCLFRQGACRRIVVEAKKSRRWHRWRLWATWKQEGASKVQGCAGKSGPARQKFRLPTDAGTPSSVRNTSAVRRPRRLRFLLMGCKSGQFRNA